MQLMNSYVLFNCNNMNNWATLEMKWDHICDMALHRGKVTQTVKSVDKKHVTIQQNTVFLMQKYPQSLTNY